MKEGQEAVSVLKEWIGLHGKPMKVMHIYSQSDEWVGYNKSQITFMIRTYLIVLSALTTFFIGLWKNIFNSTKAIHYNSSTFTEICANR